MFRAFPQRVNAAVSSARITVVVGIVLAWVQHSDCYRWLMAEPEETVVVIDLRDTLVLGTLIATLEETIRWLVPTFETTGVVQIANRVASKAQHRPIRLVSFAVIVFLTAAISLLTITNTLDAATLGVALISSALAFAGLRSQATLADVRHHPVTRAVVAALEPPEPSEADGD